MATSFSLQSVLDYRHTRVEMLEIELGSLLLEHKQLSGLLDSLRISLGRVMKKLALAQSGTLDLSTIEILRTNIKLLSIKIEKQEEELDALNTKISAKRAEIVSAKQDEEMLIVLKEKEEERQHELEKANENKNRDDIYIAQAFRRQAEHHPQG
jgi:flagellar export protein FliJ